MARRGRNEGTIRQRRDGRWEARLVITDAEGRRGRRSFLGRTRTDVRDKLQEAMRAEATGIAVPSTRLTVAHFLAQWLAVVAKPSVRPTTFVIYESICRLHLVPGLGQVSLARVTPQQVQAFLNAKSAAGCSPRSVAMYRAVLRQALGQAERWGLVTRNVAKLTDAPRVPRRLIRPLDPDQARTFIEAIRGDRFEALYLVALGAGLRQGEILGLSWADVDLEAGTLTVRQALQRVGGKLVLVEPKSVTSHRAVALPGVVLDGLRRHRVRQLEERLGGGAGWRGNDWDLVFTTTVGTPLDGIAVTRRFQSLLESAGLPHQRFHDLRHACASLLIAKGVSPRVVMETLGHSQISLTMNTYSHVTSALGRAAAERMNELLGPLPPNAAANAPG